MVAKWRTPATAALGVGESRRRYGVQDIVEEDGNDEEWTSTFADSGELVSTLDAEGIRPASTTAREFGFATS